MSRGSGELRNSSPPLLQKTTTTTTSFSGEWVLRRETTYFASRLRFFEKGGKRERESVDDARQLLASTETNSCWFEVNEPSHNSVFPFLSFFLFLFVETFAYSPFEMGLSRKWKKISRGEFDGVEPGGTDEWLLEAKSIQAPRPGHERR